MPLTPITPASKPVSDFAAGDLQLITSVAGRIKPRMADTGYLAALGTDNAEKLALISLALDCEDHTKRAAAIAALENPGPAIPL